MPSLEILIAFFAATAVFAYMPGPAMLYATAQTLAGGRRAGLLAALGLHVGGYVHVAAASLGLAVLFDLVPVLYLVLKFAGAAYLVFLGLRMIFAPKRDMTVPDVMLKTPRRAFWQSVTVEVLNPKTAVFFLAFLPQFSDPGASLPIWAQLFLLGTIVNVMFSSADVICVVLAERITRIVQKSQAVGRVTERMGGGILVALGINVALSRS